LNEDLIISAKRIKKDDFHRIQKGHSSDGFELHAAKAKPSNAIARRNIERAEYSLLMEDETPVIFAGNAQNPKNKKEDQFLRIELDRK